MKINKILAVAAIGLGAVSAQAGWQINGNPTVTTYAGGTGSYTFTIYGNSALGADNYNLGPLLATPLTTPSATITSVSLSTGNITTIDFNSGAPYFVNVTGAATSPFTATVNWSVPNGLAPGSYDIAVALGYASTDGGLVANGSTPEDQVSVGGIIILVPAPEPAQTLAGAMLVGCGGLIFAGRRLFKKQTA